MADVGLNGLTKTLSEDVVELYEASMCVKPVSSMYLDKVASPSVEIEEDITSFRYNRLRQQFSHPSV